MANSWARPGVKCVCVFDYDGTPVGAENTDHPMLGGVYTISSVERFAAIGVSGLWLSGLEHTCAWFLGHFRPLVTQSDDVAKFTHLLSPTNTPEHV